jgi:hypothetical protein
MWENKAMRTCHGALDQEEKFLKESGLGCQQESQLDPMNSIPGEITELAQIAKGFELEPSEA